MSIWKEKEEVKKVNEGRKVTRDYHQNGNSVLNAINKQMGLLHGAKGEVEEVTSKRNYLELLKTGEPFEAVLVSSEANGDYVYYDDEYKVILPNDTMVSYGLVTGGSDKLFLLGDNSLKFKVVSVSESPNAAGKYEVYVEICDKKTTNGYRTTAKEAVSRELDMRLARGEEPIVWGRVTKVRDRDIMVDLCDVGILGELGAASWQAAYTRSLVGLVREGDYYQFQVTGKSEGQKGKQTMYFLSRRKLAGDLWELANLAELEAGQQIVVTCTEVPDGKTYWWGTSERLPGVQVMCDYSQKYVANVTIFPGIKYICRVKRIDKVDYRGDSSFRVSAKPLKICKEDVATVSRLRRLHNVKSEVAKDIVEE